VGDPRPRSISAAADRVVVLGESSGRHKSTGNEFRSPFAHALVVRDGRIAEWQAFIDTALARDTAK
jgi:ketosteroid isomerase-like protein